MERWSYKPEVEGLSPSLGTNFILQLYRGVTHPGRTVTVRERGVPRGMVGLTPRPRNIADCQFAIAYWS